MAQPIVSGVGTVEIGHSSSIGDNVQIIFSMPGKVVIGDYCSLGPGVKIICSGGDATIGDWTTLHDGCLVLSGKHNVIGDHCWFGQLSVLDGSGGLTIGRGVRVGMYSQIWSHVAAGEQIEGCTLYGERPVTIEDDVWLVGSCIVASGVTLGRRTVALIGSNITKSWPENSVLAGSPAAPKQNISFYKQITLDEKWVLLSGWASDISRELHLTLTADTKEALVLADETGGRVFFAKLSSAASELRATHPGATVCCIDDKTYNKCLTTVEKRVLKYLAGNKARFFAI